MRVTVDLPFEEIPPNTDRIDGPGTSSSLDPVDTFSGSFQYSRVDAAIDGRGPSPVFARSYNSLDTRSGPLGPGWTHTYNVHLANPGDPAHPDDRVLVGPDNRSDRYTSQGKNPVDRTMSFAAPAGVYRQLVRNQNSTYVANNQDGSTFGFDATGRLTQITDRYGNRSTLTYVQGKLTSVSEPAARGLLNFGYDATSGRLTSVTDWTNRVVHYGYDTSGRLATVTDRNGQVTSYAYDGTSARLTTITDANAHVAVTNHYDVNGRVDQQLDAKSNLTTFAYAAGSTTVTYPATSFDAKQTTVTDTYDPQRRVTQQVTTPSTVAGETYTTMLGYDSNSNRTSFTDALGNTTTLCYDVAYDGTAIPSSQAQGNITRRIAPPPIAGGSPVVTLFRYDSRNNLLEAIPPKGVNAPAGTTCATNLSASTNTAFATNYTYL